MAKGFTVGLITAAAIAGGSIVGYRVLTGDESVQLLREQAGELKALSQHNAKLQDDLSKLRVRFNEVVDTFNTVVTRTAVTELLVEDGRLTVIVRRIDGSMQRIPTSFDPKGEIYVDYVVLDGRLWIRRVFDGRTPPERGLLVDPGLKSVDWKGTTAPYGKAVYRSLDEGRWIITVTGDGSLGLAPASRHEHATLATAPEVKEFEPIEIDAADEPTQPKQR